MLYKKVSITPVLLPKHKRKTKKTNIKFDIVFDKETYDLPRFVSKPLDAGYYLYPHYVSDQWAANKLVRYLIKQTRKEIRGYRKVLEALKTCH